MKKYEIHILKWPTEKCNNKNVLKDMGKILKFSTKRDRDMYHAGYCHGRDTRTT
jgi:hypothetical protein